MPQIALVAGAVASVVGTVASYSQQRKASRLSQQQQAVATRRSQRQAIRASQIRRAQSVASAQAGGSLESSGAKGGIGALSSQLGEQLGFSTQMSGLSQEIGSAQSSARLFGDVAGLGQLGVRYGVSKGATLGGFWDSIQPNKAPLSGGGGK